MAQQQLMFDQRPRIPHLIIRASAGTGKTYRLTSRYLKLIANGAQPQRILATTFTRKAAGEILDRIVQRLAEASLDDPAARRCSKELKLAGGPPEFFQHCLAELVDNLHRLQIQTLDSFFLQLVRSHGLESGLPARWKIVEEYEMSHLVDDAIANTLAEGEALDLVRMIAKGDASQQVGKLVRQAVEQAYEIFLAAPGEAWEQIPQAAPLADDQLTQLLDQLQAFPLDAPSLRDARDGDVQSMRDQNWDAAFERGIIKAVITGKTSYGRIPLPHPLVNIYRQLAKHVTGVLLQRLASQNRGTRRLLELFHQYYERQKTSTGAQRFDDISRRALKLIKGMRHEDLKFRTDLGVEHLLLDEFQDTSLLQWQVLLPLAQMVTSDDDQRSFFCVGDPKQAIYGWRGGESELFDAIGNQLDAQIACQTLDKSRRGAPVIVQTVNEIFGLLHQRVDLDHVQPVLARWCESFVPQTTVKTDRSGLVTLERAPRNTILDYAADRIAELYHQPGDKTIGVLTRRNDPIRALIFKLGQRGIAASEEGGNPLTDSAAVSLVLSALWLVDHPGDKACRFHVAHSPLAELFALAADNWDTAHEPFIAACGQQRERFHSDAAGKLVQGWADRLWSSCTRREASRLNQLIDTAYALDTDAYLSPAQLARFVTQHHVDDPSAERVRVMTIHQAKGLEFDIVVLPELDRNVTGQYGEVVVGRKQATGPIEKICGYVGNAKRHLLPEPLRQMMIDENRRWCREELCVLYVGLTRARSQLCMIVDQSQGPANKTLAGLVMAGLQVAPEKSARGTVWQRGDAQWMERLPADAARPMTTQLERVRGEISQHQLAPILPQPIRFAPAPALLRNRPLIAPSSLEGGNRVAAKQIIGSFRSSDTMLLGTLVHAALELVGWLDDGPPPEDQVRKRLNRVAGATERVIDAAVERFFRLISQPQLGFLLSQNYYRQAAQARHTRHFSHAAELRGLREHRFLVRGENGLVQGAIDRLVLGYCDGFPLAADVVDFKTDHLEQAPAREIEERIEHYRPQMDAYRAAVRESFRLAEQSVSVRLVFVDIDRIEVLA